MKIIFKKNEDHFQKKWRSFSKKMKIIFKKMKIIFKEKWRSFSKKNEDHFQKKWRSFSKKNEDHFQKNEDHFQRKMKIIFKEKWRSSLPKMQNLLDCRLDRDRPLRHPRWFQFLKNTISISSGTYFFRVC